MKHESRLLSDRPATLADLRRLRASAEAPAESHIGELVCMCNCGVFAAAVVSNAVVLYCANCGKKMGFQIAEG